MKNVRRLFAAVAVLAAIVLSASGCRRNVSGVVTTERTGTLLDPPAKRQPPTKVLTEACGSGGGVTPAGEAVLERMPYVQKTTTSSTALVWTADESDGLQVRITRPDGMPALQVTSHVEETEWLSEAQQHVAVLEGLHADQRYCYALFDGQTRLTRPAGFQTAPPPAQDERVSFVAFGDSGLGEADQRAVRKQIRTVPFDLMVITGDLAYPKGALEQLEANYFDMYEPLLLSMPVFPAAGNHDYATGDAGPFREVFMLPDPPEAADAPVRYSFDWGNVHFAALDTQRLDEEQARWLEDDLARTDRPWKVVYSHHPPFSSGSHGGHGKFRDLLVPILERHDVQLVLSGHDHHYERTEPINGVTYVVTGGGGRGVRAAGESDFTAFSEAVLHFVYVTVNGDEMRLHAIDATGREFDGTTIQL